MSLTKFLRISFLIYLFISTTLRAQWSNDPKANLLISGNAMDNSFCSIASTSSGGSYICWYARFREVPGDFIKLCYLDWRGKFTWLAQSVTINGPEIKPYAQWYNLAVDHDDNAIIAFTNNRDGISDIAVSKVSPSGQFLWGDSGINFEKPDTEEWYCQIAIAPDNSVFVVFQSGNITAGFSRRNRLILHRIDSDGNKVWGSDGLEISDTNRSLEEPQILLYPDGDFAVIYFSIVRSLNDWNRELLISCYNNQGQAQWSKPTLIRDTSDGFGSPAIHFTAYLTLDNSIYVTWPDYRNFGQPNIYLQSVNQDGRLTLQKNGLKLTSGYSGGQEVGRIGGEDSQGNVFVFWDATDLTYSNYYLKGQSISKLGELLWGTEGITVSAISSGSIPVVKIINDTLFVQYGVGAYASDSKSKLFIDRLNPDGQRLSDPTLLNDSFSYKSGVSQSNFVNNQSVFVWVEGLSDRVIKAQNFLKSGSIGPSVVKIDDDFNNRKSIALFYNKLDHTIYFTGLNGLHQLALLNSCGQTLFLSTFNGSCNIPLLATGLYYVVVSNSNNQCVYKGRIINI